MELKPCSDSRRFDEFVAASPHAHIHQTFEWGEIKQHFGWTPLRLVAEEDDRIVAAVSLLRTTRYGIPLLYASRGPVLDYRNDAIMSDVLRQLRDVARREHALFLRVSPGIECADEGVANALRRNAFVETPRPLQHTVSMYLDLTGRSADDVMKALHKTTRYNIRAAAKKQVEVRRVTTEDEVTAFHALLEKTGERKQIEFFPLEYFKTVFRVLAPKGMGTLYLAYVEGAPAAGAFVLSFGEKAWYMYGGLDYKFKQYFPAYALQWAAIEDCLARGVKRYDLQGIPANSESLSPHSPEWGLYHFKAGFGGETVRWLGEWDVPGLFKPLYQAASRLKLV